LEHGAYIIASVHRQSGAVESAALRRLRVNLVKPGLENPWPTKVWIAKEQSGYELAHIDVQIVTGVVFETVEEKANFLFEPIRVQDLIDSGASVRMLARLPVIITDDGR
jgi:hypothetical protein